MHTYTEAELTEYTQRYRRASDEIRSNEMELDAAALHAYRVSVKKALAHPDKQYREAAKKAIMEEFTTLMQMKAFHPVKIANLTSKDK